MFMSGPSKALSRRLIQLESHLRSENPALLEVVPTYRRLDKILYGLGFLSREESLATRIPWWPLVSILGTFSAGKSTFINNLLNEKLQFTGNQAVDDKFTVICFGQEESNRTLPGTALDADPRFPFYRMSSEIELAMAGEGKRIDHYLQLKATASPVVKGKILIDSPGFDADDQRRSTLRITSHIIDLSDLVLIFFDARHPEPGAMQDTLAHLVSGTVKRPDAGKFLYILNQIDTTAREDNPEEVVAAWQRAIAQAGLTTGRFYCIYNKDAAVPIEDAALRNRFESKRDSDMAAIEQRLRDVEIERSYRIVAYIETVCKELENDLVPALDALRARWLKRTVTYDALAAAALVVLGGVGAYNGWFEALAPAVDWLWAAPLSRVGGAVVVSVAALVVGHFWMRTLAAKGIAAGIPEEAGHVDRYLNLNMRQAFLKNTAFFRSVFAGTAAGWGRGALRRIKDIRDAAERHAQKLNDLYTDPSGRRNGLAELSSAAPAALVAPATDAVALATTGTTEEG